MSSPQVKVQDGVLQGKQCTTFYGKKYYSFEGIPYAKPPIGKLRFRNPEPPEPWTGIRDSTKPGNKCIQSNPLSGNYLDGSEDCLYLNVYTPSLPAEKIQKLPVIFFIHGGRLNLGYSNYYSPDFLLKNDVILVTINYRLHILGWLCLNLPECPGNAGLKDAAMALKWVNRNISNFNGDERNVTVSGESAGGAIAASFLTSNLTEGLYSKVVAQSGNSMADLYIVLQDPIKKASTLASYLGKNLTNERELYEFLVNAPVEDLLMAFTEAELSRPRSIMNSYFMPVVEKQFEGVEPFFTEHPSVAIRENRFHKVPILTSTNSHESALFFNVDGNVIYEEDLYYFIPQYGFVERGTQKARVIENKIHQYYLKGEKIGENCKHEYLEMVSDAFFWRDILLFAEAVSQFSDQVYVLQFNYSGGMHTRVMQSLNIKGATHGDMIQYQFYRKNKLAKATEKDKKIIDFLTDFICNFARTGKPTWSDQPFEWLPYTKAQRRTLVVDDGFKLAENYRYDKIKFWNELSQHYAKVPSKL